MFVASVLGLSLGEYFFALHLLHIAESNQLVNRAIQAVTRNGTSTAPSRPSPKTVLKPRHPDRHQEQRRTYKMIGNIAVSAPYLVGLSLIPISIS